MISSLILYCITPILLISMVISLGISIAIFPQQTISFIEENFAEIFYTVFGIATVSNLITLLLIAKQLSKLIPAIKLFAGYLKSKGWRTQTTFSMQYEKSKLVMICEQIFPLLSVFSVIFLEGMIPVAAEQHIDISGIIMSISNHLLSLKVVLAVEVFLFATLFLLLPVFASSILFEIWNDCYDYMIRRRVAR